MKLKITAAFFAASIIVAGNAPVTNAGEVSPKAIADPVAESSFYIYADIWAIGIEGEVGVAGLTSSVDVGFDDIIDNLDASLAGGFGYQKGKWGFMTEGVWLKVSTDVPTPGPLFRKADYRMEQVLADGHISYRIFECPDGKGHIDVIGGLRYTYLKNTLSFAPGLAPRRISGEGSQSWWDGYGGIKGRYNITDKWFIPYRVDVGGGGSSLAWQAMAGIGYQITPACDALLAYRYMDVDYSDGGFLYDVEVSGPILAIGYKF